MKASLISTKQAKRDEFSVEGPWIIEKLPRLHPRVMQRGSSKKHEEIERLNKNTVASTQYFTNLVVYKDKTGRKEKKGNQ